MHYKNSAKYTAEGPPGVYGERAFALRPRERAITQGVDYLSDLELVEAMLGSGTRAQPVQRVAGRVLDTLDRHPGRPSLDSLLDIAGMGVARSVMVCAAMELARRLYYPGRLRVRGPADILPLLRHYADRQQEYLLCLSLNGAHEIIACRVVTMGILNKTIVHPREVFADPLADRAAAIIIAHNHPSGSLDPSTEDQEVTNRLVQVGDMVGIRVLDHLIFSDQGHTSLLELGLL